MPGGPLLTRGVSVRGLGSIRRRLPVAAFAGDAPSSCAGLSASAAIGGGDDAIINGVAQCTNALITQSPTLASQLASVWSSAEQGAAEGLSIGGTIGAAMAMNILPLAVLISESLAIDIIDEINIALAATAGVAISGGAAGGSAIGGVGAIIGLIVGAIIAAITLVTGGPNVTITNGRTFKCKDYASTNLANASKFFKTNPSLVGMTPLWVANQFDLFLANPVWLYENQNVIGLAQPPPPDANSGDPLDLIYRQLPGAFELLNKAQLTHAAQIVAATPSQLPFYSSIPNPFPGPSSGKDENGNAVPGQGAIGLLGAGLFPDQVIAHYQPLDAEAMEGGALVDAAPQWMPGSFGDSDTNPAYAACPNLLTNDIIATGDPATGGKITGQTAFITTLTSTGLKMLPPQGIYALQVLYPGLTTDQCNRMFQANQAAYENLLSAATAWAMQQTYPPIASQFIAANPQWNLVAADVETIQKAWSTAHMAQVASAIAKGEAHLAGGTANVATIRGALGIGTGAAASAPAPAAPFKLPLGIPVRAPTPPSLSLASAHQAIAQQGTSAAAAGFVAARSPARTLETRSASRTPKS